jgi:hypothetical protein
MLTDPEDSRPDLVVPGIGFDFPGIRGLLDDLCDSRAKVGIHPASDDGTSLFQE